MKKILTFFMLAAAVASASELPCPLTLDEAIAYGLDHSPSLKQVKENLLVQKGVLVESVGKILPSVTASGSATRVDDSFLNYDAARLAGQNDWSAGVVAKYNLFSGGKNSSNIRASYDEVKAAKEQLHAALDETLLGIKQAFYGVVLARETIEVRREALDVLETQLKNVTARRTAGTASDFEVLQAQVAVANERPNFIRAQNDYRVAVNQLALAIGYVGAKELLGEDVSGELKITETNPDLQKLLELAYENRPDLKQAHRTALAAKNKVWAAGAAYLPTVDLTGGYAWEKSSLTSEMEQGYLKGWQVGVSSSWTLFDGFAREAKLVEARATERAAQAAYTQERLNTEVTIREAFSDFTQAKDILVSAEKTVDEARESLRLSKARFDAGTSTQLDVLQAQSALSQSRLNLLNSRYSYIIDCAKLDRATGSKKWNISIDGANSTVQTTAISTATPVTAPAAVAQTTPVPAAAAH
jgi:outer membrane protein